MTVYRRRREFDLLVDPSRTISNAELDSTIHALRIDHPEVGETMTWGHLRAAGIKVSRERVRSALR